MTQPPPVSRITEILRILLAVVGAATAGLALFLLVLGVERFFWLLNPALVGVLAITAFVASRRSAQQVRAGRTSILRILGTHVALLLLAVALAFLVAGISVSIIWQDGPLPGVAAFALWMIETPFLWAAFTYLWVHSLRDEDG